VAKYGEASYYLSNPPNKDLYPKLIQGEGARPGIGIQGWLAVAADTKDGRGVVVQKYTFTNATTSRPLTTYRAYGFDLLTGEIIGAYNYQGNFIPNAELAKPDTSDLVPGIRLAYTNNEQAIFAEIDSWLQKFDAIINPNSSSSGNTEGRHGTKEPQSPKTYAGTAKKADIFTLSGTPGFGTENANRITNFNPKEKDKLQINTSDFGRDVVGTFKIAKNSKELTKAMASPTRFIYLKRTGELYYNENSNLPGYGEGGIFAILENKANITTKNVEFL